MYSKYRRQQSFSNSAVCVCVFRLFFFSQAHLSNTCAKCLTVDDINVVASTDVSAG